MKGKTALRQLEKTLLRTADRDRYLKFIEQALTKLERIEEQFEGLNPEAFDDVIKECLETQAYKKRIEAIDLDEVQENLDFICNIIDMNINVREEYNNIKNLIDTLRGVKDE